MNKSDSWKMFDLISPTYDRVNRILSFGMDRRWREKVASSIPDKPHLNILDLATGTGDQAAALLKKGSVTGIDLSTEMLQIAKKKVKGAHFLHADAQELPFKDGSFDIATFSFGIRNVPNPLRSLEEIHRVLKPKGSCHILEFSLPPKPIRGFYLFYLRYILPKIGGFLSKKYEAYRYLNQTIEEFPSGKEFCLLLEKAGFQNIKEIPMALGGVTLYIGAK